MTDEHKTHKGRLAAALIAGPAVTAGMLGLGAAPVYADEHEADSADVVEETQDVEDADAEAETEAETEDAEVDEADAEDAEDADSAEDADDAEGADDLPTITVGPRDVTGREDEFFQVTGDPAPVHVVDGDGELQVIGYVAQGGVVHHGSGDLGAEDDGFSRVSSFDGIFQEHFGESVVYFSPEDVAPVADGAPDEDAPETDVPESDVPVLEFPPRDATDFQDEVVLVITERAPVFDRGSDSDEPVAYIAEGSIVRYQGDLERVDDPGEFVTLTDELFERELGLNSVSIRTDHITLVDDDSVVSDGPRPEAPDAEASTMELADPEYDGDLWNLAVVTDRAPVYGSYTEGLNEEVMAYIPAGTLIRFADFESPEHVEDGRNPDLIGQRIMVQSPELAFALDTTDFFLFYIPTDFLRNANDDDVEIFYEDDEEDESPSDEDPTDEDEAAEVSVSLDVDEVEPGGQVEVTAAGLDAGEDVTVELNPTLAEVAADDGGAVETVVTIPTDTEPGDYEVVVTGEDSGAVGFADLTVLVPTAASADEEDAPEEESEAPADGADEAGEVVEESTEGTAEVTIEDASEGTVEATTADVPAVESTGDKLAETGAEARTAGLVAGIFLALGAGLMALAHRMRLVRRRS